VIAPGQVVVDGRVYIPAGLWRRVAAFLIDMVLLWLLLLLALELVGWSHNPDELLAIMEQVFAESMAGGTVSEETLSRYEDYLRVFSFARWLNVAICAAYYTVFHGMLGATLGKLCLGLTVMRHDGRPLGYGWALLRYAGYWLAAKLVYTAWLIPFDPRKRTLYDIVLGTNVFRMVSSERVQSRVHDRSER
jgi:uncharacterized RDD family membrane protein YckC